MRVVTVYPRRAAAEIGDGEPCDECPRTVGRGRRLVRISDERGTRVEQVCSACATRLRRSDPETGATPLRSFFPRRKTRGTI